MIGEIEPAFDRNPIDYGLNNYFGAGRQCADLIAGL
jgi:hypothetical protein